MCMINDSDGSVTLLHERFLTARKKHICLECSRTIQPGENYTVERFIWEDSANTHKTCRHCMVVRNWLINECGGFVYGMLAQDVNEHVQEGSYGKGVIMLSVGIWRAWEKKDGSMWRVPSLPKTTHQIMAA